MALLTLVLVAACTALEEPTPRDAEALAPGVYRGKLSFAISDMWFGRGPPWPRRARLALLHGQGTGFALPIAPWREVWIAPWAQLEPVGPADVVVGRWDGELVVFGWRPLDPGWPRRWDQDGPEQRN